jgi:glycosyltransferase involved in cell wall biosynthesis
MFVNEHHLNNVYFIGFVNQTELYRYYMSADFFVLPSGYGETWGLVANEAMNYALPLLISDEVGCTPDLIMEGINGFTFPCGDTSELGNKLDYFSEIDTVELKKMGSESFKIIQDYSIDKALEGFKLAITA